MPICRECVQIGVSKTLTREIINKLETTKFKGTVARFFKKENLEGLDYVIHELTNSIFLYRDSDCFNFVQDIIKNRVNEMEQFKQKIKDK